MTRPGKPEHLEMMASAYLTACSVAHGDSFSGELSSMLDDTDTDPHTWQAVTDLVTGFATVTAPSLVHWQPPHEVGWRLWFSQHGDPGRGFLGLRNGSHALTLAELAATSLFATSEDRTYAAYNEAMTALHDLAAGIEQLPLRQVSHRRYTVDPEPTV